MAKKLARLVKGSLAAKRHMAKLRAMVGKGRGRASAGTGRRRTKTLKDAKALAQRVFEKPGSIVSIEETRFRNPLTRNEANDLLEKGREALSLSKRHLDAGYPVMGAMHAGMAFADGRAAEAVTPRAFVGHRDQGADLRRRAYGLIQPEIHREARRSLGLKSNPLLMTVMGNPVDYQDVFTAAQRLGYSVKDAAEIATAYHRTGRLPRIVQAQLSSPLKFNCNPAVCRNPSHFVHERITSTRGFQPGSFRTITRGGHRIIVGRPRGSTKTRAQAILHPTRNPEGTTFVTITTAHVGKPWIKAFGRVWPVVDFIGRIIKQDIGKRIYLVGDILQVENDQQRDARLRGGRPVRPNSRRNPGGGARRKVTMSLEAFARMLKARRDPRLWAAFQKKVAAYKRWTHGSMPKNVTVETVNAPGMNGIWITYDAGKSPETTYVMPRGSKRKGAWKHQWDTMPDLKNDPDAGIVLTKLKGKSRITDFYYR